METLFALFAIPVLLLGILLYVYTTKRDAKKAEQKRREEQIKTSQIIEQAGALREIREKEEKAKYSQGYQKRYLLTKNEWYEWKKLKQYADRKGLIVCVKVRLLDLIEPRKGERDYMSLLGKVQSKHVDFVICDSELRVKAVLELDDNSHDQQDRKERDEFVDLILSSVGYKVIRTRSIIETTLDGITGSNDTAQANVD